MDRNEWRERRHARVIEAVEDWDGDDTTELLVFLAQKLGITLTRIKGLCQARIEAEAESYHRPACGREEGR